MSLGSDEAPRSQADLLRDALQAKPGAVLRLVRELSPPVIGTLRHRVKGIREEDRHSAFNDAMMEILSPQSRFDPKQPLLPYLTKIAYHKAIDIARRVEPARKLVRSFQQNMAGEHTRASDVDKVSDAELAHRIRATLLALSQQAHPTDKAIIDCCLRGDMDDDSWASTLSPQARRETQYDLSTLAAHSHPRARHALRRRLIASWRTRCQLTMNLNRATRSPQTSPKRTSSASPPT
jgi:DNA-directed RNA polymerase specialized sigma24 family protein